MKKKRVPCDIQKSCLVCPYINQSYEISLKKKEQWGIQQLRQKKLLSSTRLLRTIPSPRKLGYRTIFKLAVGPEVRGHHSSNRFKFGLYQPGTRELGPDLSQCPLHSPVLRKVLPTLHEVLSNSSINPFNEKDQTGHLKYLVARSDSEGKALMLTWVVNEPMESQLTEITRRLIDQGIPVEVSAMNLHPGMSNAIWGESTTFLNGKKTLQEKIAGICLNLGPTSFFQVNPWQAENMYRRIGSLASRRDEKKVAWDLFSGVGPIACLLARSFEQVLAVEENAEATSLAQLNAQKNGVGDKVCVLSGKVEEVLSKIPRGFERPNLIVANPSRRGIQENVRTLLAGMLQENPAAELIYMSCSLESLSRDLLHFQSLGIELIELQAFDMFAHTDQLEWLARLKLIAK